MNFYKRFIGAIQRKTSHLSPTAMGCYDRLLDWYYANERPIPLEPADCWRICGAVTPADQASVSLVLGEFFERTEVGWRDRGADAAMAMRGRSGRARWFSEMPKDIRVAMAGARRARLRCAEPKWLSESQRAEILAVYTRARKLTEETGEPHEVDHIVPLTNKSVCGLHVPWNLQVLTSCDNKAKSNLLIGREFA